MTLQSSYRQQDEIPEQFRELYTAGEDGGWHLTGIEGVCSAEHCAQLEKDLSKERRMHEQTDAVFKRSGIDPACLEEYISGRAAMQDELEKVHRKLEHISIEKALTEAAAEHGIRKEAVADVLARGADFTTGEDGKITLNGQSVSAWLEDQIKTAPHWLAPSRSGNVRSFFNENVPVPFNQNPTIHELISKSWNNKKG